MKPEDTSLPPSTIRYLPEQIVRASTDACQHCTVRGNYDDCIKAKCSVHESWYVEELLRQIAENVETFRQMPSLPKD